MDYLPLIGGMITRAMAAPLKAKRKDKHIIKMNCFIVNSGVRQLQQNGKKNAFNLEFFG